MGTIWVKKAMYEAEDEVIVYIGQLQAEIKRLRLFDKLEENDWDLCCVSIPTGGDDFSIGWKVVEHYQAKPKERTIGVGKNPAEAIEQAAHVSE